MINLGVRGWLGGVREAWGAGVVGTPVNYRDEDASLTTRSII